MAAIFFFTLAILFLGMFLVGWGINTLVRPTASHSNGSMRLFGGLAQVATGLGVLYGWFELIGWLATNLK